MIAIKKNFKNFGPLEARVFTAAFYVVVMLLWTAATRKEVLEKANDIKSNHKNVIVLLNNKINRQTN